MKHVKALSVIFLSVWITGLLAAPVNQHSPEVATVKNVAVVPPLSKKTTLHIPVPAKVPTKVSESLPKKETSYVPLSSEANLHAPGDAPNKGTSRVYTSNKSTSYVSPSDEAHTPSHCEGATCAYHLKGKRDFIYRRTGSEHKTPHSSSPNAQPVGGKNRLEAELTPTRLIRIFRFSTANFIRHSKAESHLHNKYGPAKDPARSQTGGPRV